MPFRRLKCIPHWHSVANAMPPISKKWTSRTSTRRNAGGQAPATCCGPGESKLARRLYTGQSGNTERKPPTRLNTNSTPGNLSLENIFKWVNNLQRPRAGPSTKNTHTRLPTQYYPCKTTHEKHGETAQNNLRLKEPDTKQHRIYEMILFT